MRSLSEFIRRTTECQEGRSCLGYESLTLVQSQPRRVPPSTAGLLLLKYSQVFLIRSKMVLAYPQETGPKRQGNSTLTGLTGWKVP